MNSNCVASEIQVSTERKYSQYTLEEVLGLLKRSSIANKRLCNIDAEEFVKAFDIACKDAASELQDFPASLLPIHDRPTEEWKVIEDKHGMRVHIPDRYYARGWNASDCAFYFPLASEYDKLTLKVLLRALCDREQDCEQLCTKNKFRSGCLLTTRDGFTGEQLEQFRSAASVILYGFGGHRYAVRYPLDTLGGTIAVYVNNTTVLRRVLDIYYGKGDWDDSYRYCGAALDNCSFRQVTTEKIEACPPLLKLVSTGHIWIPVLEDRNSKYKQGVVEKMNKEQTQDNFMERIDSLHEREQKVDSAACEHVLECVLTRILENFKAYRE